MNESRVRRTSFALLLALTLALPTVGLVSAGTQAVACGTKWMIVEASIRNTQGTSNVLSQYKISAYACWDGVQSWAGVANQPTVTYRAGKAAGAYEKGNYLMSTNATEFWVNFHYSVACSTPPFLVSNKNWYPRMQVSKWGAGTFLAGSSDGNPCYLLTAVVLSHN